MKKRTPRAARVPTMVAMQLAPEVGITERISVDAISNEWAQVWHFNVLTDCHDLLAIAAQHKHDKQTLMVCEASGIALLNVRDRYKEKNRIGASGEELAALRLLVDVSEDFWMRQSGELFRLANITLDNARGYKRQTA
jgi:hypothetical protein